MDLRETVGNSAAQRHPWETARFWFFQRVLSGLNPGPSGGVVLDVGAGDAWFSKTLTALHPQKWKIHCLDLNYSDEFLKNPSQASPGITFSRDLPEAPAFEGALLLDVLEHAEDDFSLLNRTCESVVVGGWVLISVPAWPWLYSSHDRFLLHFRRYTYTGIKDLITRTGLIETRRGGLFFSLLPIRALQTLLDEEKSSDQSPETGIWRGGPRLTKSLHRLLVTDAWICEMLSKVAVPVPGLSWWFLCRKP